jgi:N-methylhydantoinase A/oxoprolinase/acetone carboxylase beta subunit
MRLDSQAARDSIERDIAGPLGISVEEAAWRIHDVTNEMMAGVVRRQMVEKGSADDMDTLVAFGGAGPVHATNMASKLGLRSVIIPVRAGVASAAGLTEAPIAFHIVQAKKMPLADLDGTFLEEVFAPLEQEARRRVLRATTGTASIERALDIRYHGQGFEVRISLPSGSMTSLTPADLRTLFHRAYQARFGYFYDDLVEELINLHVTASCPQDSSASRKGASGPEIAARGPKRERPAWDPASGGYVPHAVVDRHGLRAGMTVEGPAVIEENESTTVIGRGTHAMAHAGGSLVITMGVAT